MIISALVEVVSIGAIFPFLGVLTAPDFIFESQIMQPIILFFDYEAPEQLILPLTASFIFFAIIAGIVRILLLYVTTRLSFAIGADISADIYRRTLYQPFLIHTLRNSSELINGIIKKTDTVIYGVLMPFLVFISAGIMLLTAISALIFLNPIVALTTLTFIGLIYVGIVFFTRKRLEINSNLIAEESTMVVKSLQEGLGGIRDILISNSQEIYCQIFRNADLPLRKAQGDIHIISGTPRFAIEAIGMTAIALVAFILSQKAEGLVSVIPILGAIALGAQRLLPVFQQMYGSVTSMKGGKKSFIDSLDLLGQKIPDFIDNSEITPLRFQKEINIYGLGFRYSLEEPLILKNIDLTITKGSCIGIIGKTGSGKSTLVDIFMGLLQPTEGTFFVDGEPINLKNLGAWKMHIAHVPQHIYLADSSLYENIAFGIEKHKIDHELVRRAASQAQISEFIESLPNQYMTVTGERGVRLSGGQRQRIGIARALYRKANLIVFDEATSALDNETEQAVMEVINNLKQVLTIIIVAHRITTLQKCDSIIELGDKKILRAGKYSDFIS
ncbi:ABC transporter ATP-binding protein/permease [Candidatus Pseudothioglobus singularis]|nr:ABC transporter ATP-binding protein/permease [Candidatus Pseudothioglobus singularis]